MLYRRAAIRNTHHVCMCIRTGSESLVIGHNIPFSLWFMRGNEELRHEVVRRRNLVRRKQPIPRFFGSHISNEPYIQYLHAHGHFKNLTKMGPISALETLKRTKNNNIYPITRNLKEFLKAKCKKISTFW